MLQPEKIKELLTNSEKELGELKIFMKRNGYTPSSNFVHPKTGMRNTFTFGNVASNKMGKIEALKKVLEHIK